MRTGEHLTTGRRSDPYGTYDQGKFNSQKMEYWDSPEAKAQYSAESWYNFLFLGERLAFEYCFDDGLKAKRVLDLGCGAGRTTHVLHEMGAKVKGVDSSRALIEAARERAPHLEFEQGDAERLQYPDRSFDVVLFSFNGLDCLYPKKRRCAALVEIRRVLRPGGRFIFSHHSVPVFLFGGTNFARPWPSVMRFRLSHILNGNAFRRECYLSNPSDSGGIIYYNAHPKQVISDMRALGFELGRMFPNSELLWRLQSKIGTFWFTEHMDVWPYYIFVKT